MVEIECIDRQSVDEWLLKSMSLENIIAENFSLKSEFGGEFTTRILWPDREFNVELQGLQCFSTDRRKLVTGRRFV